MPGEREKQARTKTRAVITALANGSESAVIERIPNRPKFEYKPARGGGTAPFKPGESGNPGGAKPQVVDGVHIPTLAREHCAEAIRITVGIMRDTEAENVDRLRAVNTILDRGLGKAPAVVAHLNARDAVEYSDEELLAFIDGRVIPQGD